MSTNTNTNNIDPLDFFTFVEVTHKAPDAVQKACILHKESEQTK